MSETASVATDLVAAHERRLAALDPLVRTTHPFPEPQPEDTVLTADGGLALLRRERPDPESFLATWSAAELHRLAVRVAGPGPAAAMDALLDQCRERVAPQVSPDDPDTAVDLTWPSRDTVMARTFLTRGLVPQAVIAARPVGRPVADLPGDARVRPIAPGDAEAATGLWLEEVRWDAQFGSTTERPSTVAAIRRELDGIIAREPSWAWVAELAGEVVGLLVVSPPERAEWIAQLTSSSPVAYLTCLVVGAEKRGGGVGAALVRQAHAALDAAGVGVTLLHYAALNPLSGPFWHRSGYRPLWTIWQARPASLLRGGGGTG